MLVEIVPYLCIALTIAFVVVASQWISKKILSRYPVYLYVFLAIIIVLCWLRGFSRFTVIASDNFWWTVILMGLVAGIVIDRILIKVDISSAHLAEKRSSSRFFLLGYHYYVSNVIVVALLTYSALPLVVTYLPVGISSREILTVIETRRDCHRSACNFRVGFLFENGQDVGSAWFKLELPKFLQANSRVVAEGRQLLGIFAVERFQPLDVAE